MRTRVLTLCVVFSSLLFVQDLRPEQKPPIERAAAEALPADEAPLDGAHTRPFASKHQQRKLVDPWRVTDHAYVPKGGSCLPNMQCVCSEVEINFYCGSGYSSCVKATQGSYCRYLCDFMNECESITAAECQASNPCTN